ncbi:MAG: hypothetical protein ACOZCO_12105 [Bacteroidota bacterium]
MKKLFFVAATAVFLFSCTAETKTGTGEASNPEMDQLKTENDKLKKELAEKDEAYNESIRTLNEIEDNLSLIRQKENIINLSRNNDPELAEDQKTRIIEEITIINSLMEENKGKIANLRGKLKKGDMKIGELEKMIENLLTKINDQDQIIASLREELTQFDIAMDELTATLNETVAVVEDQEAELNKAFYVIGSTKELKENGIITKEGGFIGLGRMIKLREDMNKDYFTQVDITKVKEIMLGGKKMQILTTHPPASYKVTGTDSNKEKIEILDAEDFWSISKYLVVVLD